MTIVARTDTVFCTLQITGVMIKVDDLDAKCKQVDALGGRTAEGPMTINDGLRMAVCYDPTGQFLTSFKYARCCSAQSVVSKSET